MGRGPRGALAPDWAGGVPGCAGGGWPWAAPAPSSPLPPPAPLRRLRPPRRLPALPAGRGPLVDVLVSAWPWPWPWPWPWAGAGAGASVSAVALAGASQCTAAASAAAPCAASGAGWPAALPAAGAVGAAAGAAAAAVSAAAAAAVSAAAAAGTAVPAAGAGGAAFGERSGTWSVMAGGQKGGWGKNPPSCQPCTAPLRAGSAPAPARGAAGHCASASSSTCTQWRTGVSVPLCRCVMQPMLAEVMTVGSSACRWPSLRSRSCLDSSGCSTE